MCCSKNFLVTAFALAVICGLGYINSPYYSKENLRYWCCSKWLSICRVSDMCYNPFKYWVPNFDEILQEKSPLKISSIGGGRMHSYLNWREIFPEKTLC